MKGPRQPGLNPRTPPREDQIALLHYFIKGVLKPKAPKSFWGYSLLTKIVLPTASQLSIHIIWWTIIMQRTCLTERIRRIQQSAGFEPRPSWSWAMRSTDALQLLETQWLKMILKGFKEWRHRDSLAADLSQRWARKEEKPVQQISDEATTLSWCVLTRFKYFIALLKCINLFLSATCC